MDDTQEKDADDATEIAALFRDGLLQESEAMELLKVVQVEGQHKDEF